MWWRCKLKTKSPPDTLQPVLQKYCIFGKVFQPIAMKNAMIACNTTKLNAIIVHRVVFISSATAFFFICSRAFAIWLLKLRGTSTCSLQWFCGVSRWKFVHFVIKFIHLLLNNWIYTVWCVHFEVSFHLSFVLPRSETLFGYKV